MNEELESSGEHKAPPKLKPTGSAGKSRKTRRRRREAAESTKTPNDGAPATRHGRGYAAPFPPLAFSSVIPFAEAIQAHGAGQKIRRLTLFDKLGRSPESGPSRQLIINSGRYGLTKGGYAAEFLELTSLGKLATSPEAGPAEKLSARFKLAIEAVPAFKLLYEKNRSGRIPSPEVLRDSLAEAAVPEPLRRQCVDVFLENLKYLGLLQTIAGAERVISIEQVLEETPAGSQPAANPAVEAGSPAPAKAVEKTKGKWAKVCFVIAPIGAENSEERKHSDMVLEALIRRALETEGYDVVRADQISEPGMISGQVVEHLLNAGLVVADLSFHNPNVFYELAIRHAIGKPTVHLIRKDDAIPFDLKDFRTITIDTNDKYELVAKLETYRSEIANHVREALATGSVQSNPIRSFAKDLNVTVGTKPT